MDQTKQYCSQGACRALFSCHLVKLSLFLFKAGEVGGQEALRELISGYDAGDWEEIQKEKGDMVRLGQGHVVGWALLGTRRGWQMPEKERS